ncbi:hypothetical protein BDQ12DRAFT_684945 [Crucibulum laeve]|uniref:Cupredoxin n=1 Tax=Crucibulum laeve TaxID=68775 RepID=A0A5C3LY15_9AGAR|nr:hypothetical protein BDQ12DRAFT_684945 [Crucibulum laeve]
MKSIALVALFLPLAFGAEYLVGVGKDETTGKKGLGFDPSSIHPLSGDVINFEFRSGSHSVVQSSYENPCTSNGGFNSGVITVADDLAVDASGLPSVKLTVNSTEPLWFFDEAGGLCNQGAVLSVNPSQTQTAAGFKENAAKAPATPATSATPSTTEDHSSHASESATGTAPGSSGAAQTSPASNAATKDGAIQFAGIAAVMAMFMGFF